MSIGTRNSQSVGGERVSALSEIRRLPGEVAGLRERVAETAAMVEETARVALIAFGLVAIVAVSALLLALGREQ